MYQKGKSATWAPHVPLAVERRVENEYKRFLWHLPM